MSAQNVDEYGCVIITGLHVPFDFIRIRDLEDEIHFDTELQEHFLKRKEASEAKDGKWHQTIVRDNDNTAPTWALSIPNLESRIEQWRVNNVMSPEFKDECH